MSDLIYVFATVAFFRRGRRVHPRLRKAVRRAIVTFDYVLGGALALALTAYLVYALLRPERF